MAKNDKSSKEELVLAFQDVLKKASKEERLFLAGSIAAIEYANAGKAVEQ